MRPTERAELLLARMLGPDARFRPGQREAIEAIVREGTRLLLVQKTGWGKSLVYWIATRLRREAGAGPTLLVSPLLSLMRNQIRMAQRIGVRAFTINSANRAEWGAILRALRQGECDVLLVSPERFADERFRVDIMPTLGSVGLLVVDEAHCISDWGHDFRPDYRRITRVVQSLPRSVPILATTATANNRVVADVAAQLGPDVHTQRGPLARESLSLHVLALPEPAQRLAWLAREVPLLPGSGIIYCLTQRDTERVAAWLQRRGVSAKAYNADLPTEEREQLEDALLENQIKVLVATVALGLGFDKADLGFVIHYQRPASPVAYYQQVGRAGRSLDHALAVLLCGAEDDEINTHFIERAFPSPQEMEDVLEELETHNRTLRELESRLNVSQTRLKTVLKMLEVEGAIGHTGREYFRTPNAWEPDVDRVERVTAMRREELDRMREYAEHPGCLMQFLTRALDDPEARSCGRCANDGATRLDPLVDPHLLEEAKRFLEREPKPIHPRKWWPLAQDSTLRGAIRPPNREGFALSTYGESLLGRLVEAGKYRDGRFDERLVQAAVELITSRWRPEPFPRWVTAIPSTSRPGLVGPVAVAIARALGLPFVEVLAATAMGLPQKDMQNSAHQLRNLRAKLKVISSVPREPVLLIDDIVDSGWTLTYAGWLLSSHGATAVHPLALAAVTTRNNDQ